MHEPPQGQYCAMYADCLWHNLKGRPGQVCLPYQIHNHACMPMQTTKTFA